MADEKILKDEILSDEQLDEVAGGTYLESSSDALKFQKLGVDLGIKDVAGIAIMGHDEFVKLRDTFQQYGVTIKDHGGLINANEYFIDGKAVSRDDAWKHIQAQIK